jgi:hypothetical protein
LGKGGKKVAHVCEIFTHFTAHFFRLFVMRQLADIKRSAERKYRLLSETQIERMTPMTRMFLPIVRLTDEADGADDTIV